MGYNMFYIILKGLIYNNEDIESEAVLIESVKKSYPSFQGNSIEDIADRCMCDETLIETLAEILDVADRELQIGIEFQKIRDLKIKSKIRYEQLQAEMEESHLFFLCKTNRFITDWLGQRDVEEEYKLAEYMGYSHQEFLHMLSHNYLFSSRQIKKISLHTGIDYDELLKMITYDRNALTTKSHLKHIIDRYSVAEMMRYLRINVKHMERQEFVEWILARLEELGEPIVFIRDIIYHIESGEITYLLPEYCDALKKLFPQYQHKIESFRIAAPDDELMKIRM